MTVENIFMINLHERILPTRRGPNPKPPDHQSDALLTEPPRPAHFEKVDFLYVAIDAIFITECSIQILYKCLVQSVQGTAFKCM